MRSIALLLALSWPAVAAHAQTSEDFFRGKTITIITSTGSGGAYDHAARALTRHLPRIRFEFDVWRLRLR